MNNVITGRKKQNVLKPGGETKSCWLALAGFLSLLFSKKILKSEYFLSFLCNFCNSRIIGNVTEAKPKRLPGGIARYCVVKTLRVQNHFVT